MRRESMHNKESNLLDSQNGATHYTFLIKGAINVFTRMVDRREMACRILGRLWQKTEI